ncbi:hypothetical protein CsSME_00048712 [Camellia sinensis var. sinensis]
MPLGEVVRDKSDSRYCGVETEFNDDMPQLLAFNINGGFDFVVSPLPGYGDTAEETKEERARRELGRRLQSDLVADLIDLFAKLIDLRSLIYEVDRLLI